MDQQNAKPALTVKSLFEGDKVKARFTEMLGRKAEGFITSVLQLVANDKNLAAVDPISVYNAAAVAATLDLPINNSLGFAWIVPYKGKAQFQIGAKGYVQLAQRSGQYSRMNVVEAYENQFTGYNALTEDLEADFNKIPEGKVVGYCAFFRLINGFEKLVYWNMEKVIAHAQRHSKSYGKDNSTWSTDFNAMAKKTVLKNTLAPWGIMSIQMQLAVKVDQAVITNSDDNTIDVDYVDGTGDDITNPNEKAGAATQAAMDELKKQAEKK